MLVTVLFSEKSKEEISQEDLFGALSALNNSPGLASPQSKAESSTSRESTQTVLSQLLPNFDCFLIEIY